VTICPLPIRRANFYLKAGYRHRSEPQYFVDDIAAASGITHQPRVYPLAAHIAPLFGCESILDLGCGRAAKLMKFCPPLNAVGVDFGPNLESCRSAYPAQTWINHDFERAPLVLSERELVRRSVVVCSDVIEHVADPLPLLETLSDLMQDSPVALISTPERDLVRGASDLGPPQNPHHIREWSLDEFGQLLRAAGLEVEFLGLTENNDVDRAKRTCLAIVTRPRRTRRAAPASFRVLALMCAFNEADVIGPVLQELTSQGVEVHLIDNWSTDSTVDRASAFFGKGLTSITRFPASGPTGTYDWHALLTHVEQLGLEAQADWIIHHDADEIRESPWPGVSIKQALYQVEEQGFNCIDHTCLVFPPSDGRAFPLDGDLHSHFRGFQFGNRPGHFLQLKAWKRQPIRVRLAASGGHWAEFDNARVYPWKFLLRHYPFRSQQHGLRKVLGERQARWNENERAHRGWHTQYDDIGPDHSFIARPDTLLDFGPDFAERYLVERLTGIGIRE
jgi:SAM-dependent methyltransferase